MGPRKPGARTERRARPRSRLTEQYRGLTSELSSRNRVKDGKKGGNRALEMPFSRPGERTGEMRVDRCPALSVLATVGLGEQQGGCAGRGSPPMPGVSEKDCGAEV